MIKELLPGAEFSWTKTITEADILAFAELSEDKGRHHLEKDSRGRLMAHGLLVATLPTKLGGQLDYIARTMRFDFLRPVYSGDALTCVGTVASVLAKPGRRKVRFAFEIVNQDGVLVVKGGTDGVIYDRPDGASSAAAASKPRDSGRK